jgi:phosphosulfolactate synthase
MLPWGVGKENIRHHQLTACEGFCLERSMSTSGTSCIAAQLKEVIGSGLTNKPREIGLTAVLDKGLGLRAMHDLIELSGSYIDVVKFGWGTSVLYPPQTLMDKIALVRAAGIAVCPGGTLLELAWANARTEAFFAFAEDVGFTTIEVSDGTYNMPRHVKLALIERAVRLGFRVVSEVGKKNPENDAQLTSVQRVAMVRQELEAGAWKVIVEGRESGTVGIYDAHGAVQGELADALVAALGVTSLVFEAPQKSQQVWLIQRYGAQVNFGNIPPEEVLSLTTLRCGLRSDTAMPALPEVLQEEAWAVPLRLGAI